MPRSLLVLVVILGLGGCTGTRTLSESCAGVVVPTAVTNELQDRAACTQRIAGHERVAVFGAARQTGTQTRTVGVPRGFLVAMIILIVLVGLV